MLKTDNFDYPADNVSFPKAEEEVLKYWKEINAFNRQQELTKHKPRFVFLDGPPFATGQPHYGHLLAGTIKDVVCRYQAQNGFYVPRRFGWDTHGLPVEQIINQKLNIKSPEQVHQMGIAKYNAECRGAVMRYAKEWEEVVTRMGRWIDFENDYKTLKPEFMETVWWVFKQLWDKDLVYQGIKVMPFSTALSSALSNFEANQNYKEDTIDPCCVVSFPIVGQENTYLTAWTTTPWTLPSNLALCVNPELPYVKVRDPDSNKLFWLGESRVIELYPPKKGQKGPTVEIVEKCLGKDLVGLRYEPLFKYFEHLLQEQPKIWTVLSDGYVTADSGTGIVHQSPYFGEDDYRVCLAHGVIRADSTIVCPVDECGCFTAHVTDYQGIYVKDADSKIMKDLKARGRLLKQGTIKHSYPFCYRSDTPLIYKAVPSWFVRVERIKDRMQANNMKSQWVPDFVQHKRFHNWIAGARDWAISRDRFWGCPIPVWRSADGEVEICISSRKDLAERAGIDPATLNDLHREFIDDITIPDPRGGDREPLKRITQVFDCWFESGSMPYGQVHYPFECVDGTTLENGLPGTDSFKTSGEGGLADFIAEGLDQTRGWFYTLLILSTCLFDRPPATHCIVNGLVLASNGQKMSKRLNNYDPVDQVINSFGADAIRLYLCKSPAVRALEIRFDSQGVSEVVKAVLLQWFNAFRFFAQQVCRYELTTGQKFVPLTLDQMIAQGDQLCLLDKWMLQNLGELAAAVHKGMEEYKLYAVFPRVVDFIDDLTKWYIRFHRDVLKSNDSWRSLNVLCYLLFQLSVLMAPYAPFFSEYTYQRLLVLLKRQGTETFESVHFCQVPVYQKDTFAFDDPRLTIKLERFKKVIVLARQCRRDRCGISSFKTPLASVTIVHADNQSVTDLNELVEYIGAELNVLEVHFHVGEDGFGTAQLQPDFTAMRAELTAQEAPKEAIGAAAKALTAFQKKATPEQLQTLREGKNVLFDGVEITPQFCAVRLVPERESASADESGYLVEFDLKQSDGLIQRSLERLLLSKINKGRKEIGAQLSDTVDVIIHRFGETGAALLNEVVTQLKDRIKGAIIVKDTSGDVKQDDDVIEISDVTCTIELRQNK